VGKKDLGKKAVRPKHIKNRAVKTKHIRDGAVTGDKLSDNAKPAKTAVGTLNELQLLDTTDKIITSVSVEAPAAGVVTVFASWYFTGNTTMTTRVYCSITPGTTVDFEQNTTAKPEPIEPIPASAHRSFPVSAGSHTYNLVCFSDTTAYVQKAAISGIYTPGG
jgi:hypothetical protein